MASKAKPRNAVGGKVLTWGAGIVSFSIFVLLVMMMIAQFFQPPPPPRLQLVGDVPLPAALPLSLIPNLREEPQQQDPLAAGLSVSFDHFDAQAFDPTTKLLFIAHTGPAPGKYRQADPAFDSNKDVRHDGQVVVFDTVRNKVVGRVDIPQVTGMVAAPGSELVFASGSADNTVYEIRERTLGYTRIPLGDNERPDALSYDADDHKVFVSDLGTPKSGVIDPRNQNLAVIDLRTNAVTKINIGRLQIKPNEHGSLANWGYAIGHNRYDAPLHRVFVTIQQLTDPHVQPAPIPPAGTGELLSISPTTDQLVSRLSLPRTCGTPHGMAIDVQQQVAFIACTDDDPGQKLVPNLVRVDLRSMKALPERQALTLPLKPDMLALDSPMHVLLIGSSTAVSVFDESRGQLRKLGDYNLGKGTHTVAVDEATQRIYLPLVDVGGRPTLRIARYDPAGT